MANGESFTLYIRGTVSVAQCTAVSNIATVSSDVRDDDLADNIYTVSTDILDQIAPMISSCPVARNIAGCNTAAITNPPYSAVLASSSYSEFSNATNQGVVSDNCSVGNVFYIDVASGSCPITVIRTWTVSDASGNMVECEQQIIVVDNIAPSASAPALINGIQCIANVPSPDPLVVTDENDNCGGVVTVSWLSDANNGGSGCPSSPYIVNRIYRVTDQCGNYTDVTQNIIVTDNTPPIITGTIPASSVIGCTTADAPGAVSTIAALESLGITINDNCTPKTNLLLSSSSTSSGICPLVVTRTYIITDLCGNSTNCVHIITINPPVVAFLCPSSVIEPACQSQDAINTAFSFWLATASASGGCNGVLTSNPMSPVAPSACGGSTTITWTYTNSCAPSGITCSATFTVTADMAPVISCPYTLPQVVDANSGTSYVNIGTDWDATATDDCG